MRFDGGRLHPKFDLNGGHSHGPTVVVRAARDPVQPPTDPVIVAILDKNLCTCDVFGGGWRIRNQFGDTYMIDYGASVAEWTSACEGLLRMALERDYDP